MFFLIGEHQFELLDFAAAKFHEEPGVFKLLVRTFSFLKIQNQRGAHPELLQNAGILC